VVVDAEDRFTTMLAHQLRHLGFATSIVPWSRAARSRDRGRRHRRRGPGPGDPRDDGSARIRAMRDVVAARLDGGRPCWRSA
jgi:phenazine biosynthesis protein phzE